MTRHCAESMPCIISLHLHSEWWSNSLSFYRCIHFLFGLLLVFLVVAGFCACNYCEAVGFQSYYRALEGGMGIGQVKTLQSLLFLSRCSIFCWLNTLQIVVSLWLISRVLKKFVLIHFSHVLLGADFGGPICTIPTDVLGVIVFSMGGND